MTGTDERPLLICLPNGEGRLGPHSYPIMLALGTRPFGGADPMLQLLRPSGPLADERAPNLEEERLTARLKEWPIDHRAPDIGRFG